MMKTRTWGESVWELSSPHKVPMPFRVFTTQFCLGSEKMCLTIFCREAVVDYRKNRENENEKDNPDYNFPNDGEYTWSTPNAMTSKVRYNEGHKDKLWMEKKDQNYLNRSIQEEKKQDEHIVNVIKHYQQSVLQQQKIEFEAFLNEQRAQQEAFQKTLIEQLYEQQHRQFQILSQQLKKSQQVMELNSREHQKSLEKKWIDQIKQDRTPRDDIKSKFSYQL